MAIYIKFDGIDGEVDENKHEKWTELSSFTVGAHKPGNGKTGSQRVAGTTEFHDISISKNVDKTSPKLLEALAKGKSFDKVEVHYVTTTDTGPNIITKYELKHVYITGFEQSANRDSDRRPGENMTLNYEEFKVEQFPVKPDGKLDAAVEFAWSIPKGKTA